MPTGSITFEGIDENRYYTAKQVARILGVHVNTIFNWRYAGKIKTHTFGGHVRIQGIDIINAMKRYELEEVEPNKS